MKLFRELGGALLLQRWVRTELSRRARPGWTAAGRRVSRSGRRAEGDAGRSSASRPRGRPVASR